VAIAEGAISVEEHKALLKKANSKRKVDKQPEAELQYAEKTVRLAKQLELLTGLESRITILGHLQRGGIPSATDRLLATRLGSACADMIDQGLYGVMVASRGDDIEPVLIEDVAGKTKLVPVDHPWVRSAKNIGINLGD